MDIVDKNKGGRPKESFDLDDGWQHEVLELYAVGASDAEIKALIWTKRGSFSNDLWTRWMREEPQFSEAIRYGKALSESWWASNGRTNLNNKDFSYTGWYMNMKNRFGWSDKTENKSEVVLKDFNIKETIKFVK